MTRNLRNVVFDLGGVIVDLDIERCRAAFRALGMDRVAALIDPCYPAEMIGRLERGDISFHEACEAMRTLCRTPEVTDDRIAAAYGAFLTGIPDDRFRLLDELQRRGCRTFVLSNNNPSSMERIRALFRASGREMEAWFDGIFLSYKLRCLKPDPEIFRRMIAAAGIDPAQTLFVDDGARNIAAARDLGFAVCMPTPGDDLMELLSGLLR